MLNIIYLLAQDQGVSKFTYNFRKPIQNISILIYPQITIYIKISLQFENLNWEN